ncbi:hypothetical protein [Rugamonas sp.]|uniref:hypothetical protein n=1 Tax=Rugamonas sp. TaxID=1926287 RepID=UPI0025CBCB0D|nr:hypothetical protein [Rugamonas sp.]
MDSYIAIISLALAIAALVPALVPAIRVKFWTLTVAALSLLVLLGIFQAYQEIIERSAIRNSKEQILEILTKNKSGLSFEQI